MFGVMMIFRELRRGLKPFRLMSLLLTYSLGVGLVQYVDEIHSWSDVWLGGIFLALVSLGVEYLLLLQPLELQNKWLKENSPVEAQQFRLISALLSGTFLTVAITVFIGWMLEEVLWQGFVFLLLIMILGYFLYYLSRTKVAWRSFQILFESILFVIIPPALAFFIQSQDLHRLLTLVVIGLVPAYIAYRLLTILRNYGSDQKNEIKNIVTEIGWERTMTLHNALILMTFLFYAVTTFLGFPWFLLWPVFLAFPIGLLEIWLMERVRRGGKPLWTVMRFATACVFFIPMYLIGLAFWIR